MRAIAQQTLYYGLIRGAPVSIRLMAFFMGAHFFEMPIVAALGIMHASLDLMKVLTDLGIDTFSVRRLARKPNSLSRLLKVLATVKLFAFLISSFVMILIFKNELATVGWGITICAYMANLFYCLSGIFIAEAQVNQRLKELTLRSASLYGVAIAAFFFVWINSGPVWLCYAAIAVVEFFLLALSWHASGSVLLYSFRSSKRMFCLILFSVLPIALTFAIGVIYQRIDFFAVKIYMAANEAAIYAVLQRINDPVMFFLAAASVTLFARFSRTTSGKYTILSRMRVLVPSGFAVGVLASGLLFSMSYVSGVSAVVGYHQVWIIMMIGMGLKGAILALTALLQSQFSFWIITAISAFVLIIQTTLVLTVVPEYGMIGAATSQAVCDFINFLFQLSALLISIRRRAQ